MKRRDFLIKTMSSSAGFILLPNMPASAVEAGQAFLGAGLTGSAQPSEAGILDPATFARPSAGARPYTYWMWMNGHITKEGITLDLETMHRGGIGGAYIYNNAVGIPRGPVDYNSETWKELVLHAVKEADRLELVLSIHNSPGYSGTGGPWIPPDLSMRELVWSETAVSSQMKVSAESGGQRREDPIARAGKIILPRPYAKMGSYRDAIVLAYPSLPGEQRPMRDQLIKAWANGKEIEKELITGPDLDKRIRIEPLGDHEPATLLLQFARPFGARAITLQRHPETPKDLYDGDRDYPPIFRLESSDDGVTFQPVCTLRCPPLRAMDAPAAESFAPVTASWFRLVTNNPTFIARVELHAGPRLKGWPAKTNAAGGNTEPAYAHDGYEPSLAIDPAQVIDLTDKMNKEGALDWTSLAGLRTDWTILRIGHTTTGEVTGAAPDAAIGLECDKFSKEAVDFHFSAFLDPLLARLGPLAGKSLKSILIDSWEAGKQNWTVRFPEEFQQRRSYDLRSRMAALTGRIVGSPEETERFLRDIRQTHADLVAENYYGHFADCCHRRGLELHGEPYGDGTFDSLQSGAHLDQPMGEFWTRYIYGDAMTSRQAVSLAHVYGRSIAASEAFTGMPITSRWTEYPYSLKAEADWFYTIGISRLVFHTFVHQPYTTGLPGMTMGPFGTHFDRNSTWTHDLSSWTGYLHRVQYLLQQPGKVVADLCYFKGEGIASGIPDRSRIRPAIPKGYAMDVIGADALLNRIRMENGRIVLPDGMSYTILMLATLTNLSKPVSDKIRELLSQGLVLAVNDKRDTGTASGKIFWGKTFEEIAAELRLPPDFTYTAGNSDAAIHYIHKQIGDTDVYFITNQLRRKETIVADLRIAGRQPEIWNAETGEVFCAPVFDMTENGRILLPLELSPSGSLFVLLRRKVLQAPYQFLMQELSPVSNQSGYLFCTEKFPSRRMPYGDFRNNFTVQVWIKPDTYAHRGKGFVQHAPEGELLFGPGHAAIGLAAGVNTVRVYERDKGPAREVLAIDQNLEGWTAVAIVYRQGRPSLYINGKLVKEGTASDHVVHPGMGAEVSEDQYQSFFEGNSTVPAVTQEALTEERIREWTAAGLPVPESPSAAFLRQDEAGRISLLAWEDGHYTLRGRGGMRKLAIAGVRPAIFVGGAWELQFQEGRGAPPVLHLPELISLHLHADPRVRFFSGTVVYRKNLVLPRKDRGGKTPGDRKQAGQRLFLDLGRVEVLAEVRVNGQSIGTVWKEPYRIEITKALRADALHSGSVGAATATSGTIELEIRVTTLWPNRLIGDEQLPAENEYSPFGPVLALPDWYVKNQAKPGERITFCAWHSFKKTDPLLASGLLGPVRLLTAVERQL
jgi:hypothetical protein